MYLSESAYALAVSSSQHRLSPPQLSLHLGQRDVSLPGSPGPAGMPHARRASNPSEPCSGAPSFCAVSRARRTHRIAVLTPDPKTLRTGGGGAFWGRASRQRFYGFAEPGRPAKRRRASKVTRRVRSSTSMRHSCWAWSAEKADVTLAEMQAQLRRRQAVLRRGNRQCIRAFGKVQSGNPSGRPKRSEPR